MHRMGLARRPLLCLSKCRGKALKPNEVTCICVLSACAQSCLVDEGCYVFDSMCKNHGGHTNHGTLCMYWLILLGRAGCLADAELFINKMPIEPGSVVWMSLLGAARNHGDVEIGRRAFDRVVNLEPKKCCTLCAAIKHLCNCW
ncbi:hypothetical protein O6H91_10G022700 [Diphasiastrum complanatum]|uniref:Uncharacterized protein n=1 Tax=Diphasiastrum complanatum TaxID=34168 RepID=A0ACC2CFC3_DIPCM|nr:hypothetical protein O6H91_10G022700 [Diphasiastrum complanatum]